MAKKRTKAQIIRSMKLNKKYTSDQKKILRGFAKAKTLKTKRKWFKKAQALSKKIKKL